MSTIKVAIPIIFVVLLLIYILRAYIVDILFTPEFSGMEELYLYQNIGDFIRLFNWFFSITFIVKEKISVYIFSEIFYGFNLRWISIFNNSNYGNSKLYFTVYVKYNCLSRFKSISL